MKRTLIYATILATSLLMPAHVQALSATQKDTISQHCATTKQSLKSLQRADARTRSYLGSAYEQALSNYVAPLNVRLINAGRPNSNLTDLHSEIIEVRQQFISEYTSYSQSLEDLIATDCYTSPETFYNKLTTTREKRSTLSVATTTLRNLLSEHLTSVRRLNLKGTSNE